MNKKQKILLERGELTAKAYEAWVNMRRRVKNANPNRKESCYKNISIAKDWDNFEVFLKDMGLPNINESIDRIDTNGNYEKNNCRWANATIQSRNRNIVKLNLDLANQIRFIYNTTKISQNEIAKKFNISQFMVSCIVRNKNWAF